MGKKQKTKQGGPNILHSPEWPSPEQTKPGKLFLNKDRRGASAHGDPETLIAHGHRRWKHGIPAAHASPASRLHRKSRDLGRILKRKGNVEVWLFSTSASHDSAPIA